MYMDVLAYSMELLFLWPVACVNMCPAELPALHGASLGFNWVQLVLFLRSDDLGVKRVEQADLTARLPGRRDRQPLQKDLVCHWFTG